VCSSDLFDAVRVRVLEDGRSIAVDSSGELLQIACQMEPCLASELDSWCVDHRRTLDERRIESEIRRSLRLFAESFDIGLCELAIRRRVKVRGHPRQPAGNTLCIDDFGDLPDRGEA